MSLLCFIPALVLAAFAGKFCFLLPLLLLSPLVLLLFVDCWLSQPHQFFCHIPMIILLDIVALQAYCGQTESSGIIA